MQPTITQRKLPNFLGLGAMRSGTSWLNAVLKDHPEVFMPTYIKEIHFFDDHYHRGLSWYLSFFPSDTESQGYKAGGEITPKYIYDETVPAKVKRHLPEAKFIVLLRNPVDRAYSHYKLASAKGETKVKNLSEFLDSEPTAYGRGLYAAQLSRWFNHFSENQFLILIFEEVMQSPTVATEKIAQFLDISLQGFNQGQFSEKVNASRVHKLPQMYHLGIKLNTYLRKAGLIKPAHFVEATGRRFFSLLGDSTKQDIPPLDETTHRTLMELYTPDIFKLEKLLNRDLSLWRTNIKVEKSKEIDYA